ncbi:hypothetical protein AAG570_004995 [Ranatra chinensis]|uniref:Calcium homeostasis endoplasmic reticulum protein n=1 Tax=Ranatra chinensis TaxID=642074 RepID=A0ABD0YBX6_9HEMI
MAPGLTIEAIVQQQAALHEQTNQSEQNLNAQHLVLLQQQQMQTEEAIRKCDLETLTKEAEELGINFQELDMVLQPIIDSCTKDSISNGKAWILQRATSKMVNDVLANYLLQKVLDPDRKFSHKLHIIYLVNDILHHCVRKHTEEFKLALEKVVVPMFCNTSLNVNDEQQGKLNKLLNIWELKNHYFSDDIVRKLKDPINSWNQFRSEKFAKNPEIVASFANSTKSAFAGFQSQHLAFVSHTMQQIQNLEQQKQHLEAQKQQQQDLSNGDAYQQQMLQIQQNAISQMAAAQAAALAAAQAEQSSQQELEPPGTGSGAAIPSGSAPGSGSGSGGSGSAGAVGSAAPPGTVFDLGINISQPPPGFMFPPPNIELPDLTRPPPGFPAVAPPLPPEVQPEDLLPSLPYYDLPAGLMVPLIKLEDCSYKPLDPENIRLPPPAPPSERLLAAVKAFYSPPGHDQPRDSDGWEKLGLYEYFRAKAGAKKRKDTEIVEGIRERSRSPTPVRSFHSNSKSPPARRRYSSRSRSRSRDRGSSKNSRMRRRERSRSRSPPQHQSDRENRSPTPPSFARESAEERLAESNKGHQMLRKMGWGGAGLGAKEQGIEAPISGGDIRDRTDQYKGVGINLNDPYENFRKSKGQAFITRMKARAEERS